MIQLENSTNSNKGIYTFDGWYTGLTDGVQVQSTDVPTGNVIYYARWHYEASNEVINFNMNSDALDTYFSYINSWKNETQTVFQTNMTNNFNLITVQHVQGQIIKNVQLQELVQLYVTNQKVMKQVLMTTVKVYESDDY